MKLQLSRVLTLSLALSLVASLAVAQTEMQKTPQQKRQIAVAVLRLLNTAEVTHKSRFGRFATVNEFQPSELDNSRARASNPVLPAINPLAGNEAVEGFDLRIVVSADGNSYSIKLKDKDRGNCGTDAFSDEVGVIYLAGSIDCNFDSLQAYGNTAQGQPTRIRVSQGVVMGNVVNKVDPVYPDLARQARLSGSVVYQLVIAQDGNVNNVRVVSGHPLLTQAGFDAVKQWTFKPYYLNGQPIAVETQITINFRQDGSVSTGAER